MLTEPEVVETFHHLLELDGDIDVYVLKQANQKGKEKRNGKAKT